MSVGLPDMGTLYTCWIALVVAKAGWALQQAWHDSPMLGEAAANSLVLRRRRSHQLENGLVHAHKFLSSVRIEGGDGSLQCFQSVRKGRT